MAQGGFDRSQNGEASFESAAEIHHPPRRRSQHALGRETAECREIRQHDIEFVDIGMDIGEFGRIGCQSGEHSRRGGREILPHRIGLLNQRHDLGPDEGRSGFEFAP